MVLAALGPKEPQCKSTRSQLSPKTIRGKFPSLKPSFFFELSGKRIDADTFALVCASSKSAETKMENSSDGGMPSLIVVAITKIRPAFVLPPLNGRQVARIHIGT